MIFSATDSSPTTYRTSCGVRAYAVRSPFPVKSTVFTSYSSLTLGVLDKFYENSAILGAPLVQLMYERAKSSQKRDVFPCRAHMLPSQGGDSAGPKSYRGASNRRGREANVGGRSCRVECFEKCLQSCHFICIRSTLRRSSYCGRQK